VITEERVPHDSLAERGLAAPSHASFTLMIGSALSNRQAPTTSPGRPGATVRQVLIAGVIDELTQRGHLERNWQVLDAVRKVAAWHGVSMAQVSIAWLAARPAVASVILGARSLEQLEDNLAAGGVTLSPEEMHLLDEASDPGAPDYPYGEPGQIQRTRRISGGRF
jgi:aryl-alcohol dehydrogenase-like predicted oxidoreductase